MNSFPTAVSPFIPESSFDMRAVSLLEAAAGIPVMRTLNNHARHIHTFLGLTQFLNLDLNGVLNYWISNVQHQVPPSWKNLLQIIHLLDLDELAQRMETYLSARAVEEPRDQPMEEATEEEGERSSTCN